MPEKREMENQWKKYVITSISIKFQLDNKKRPTTFFYKVGQNLRNSLELYGSFRMSHKVFINKPSFLNNLLMHDCKILECILDVLVFKDDVSVDTIKMPLDIKTTMEFIIFLSFWLR